MNLSRTLKPSHLRLIFAIARHQKLHVAAQALNMSQPAASRILADVENQIDAPLFIRHPRSMEPTHAGKAFIRHAQSILNELDILQTELINLKSGQFGQVSIGSVTGPAVAIVIPSIEVVRGKAPDIDVTLEIAPSVQLVRELKAGKFDFIIARLSDKHSSRDFRIHPGGPEAMTIIVRKTHPLAGENNLSIGDLVDYEWILQGPTSPLRQGVEETFLSAGYPMPKRTITSSSLLVSLSLLYASDCVVPLATEVADFLAKQLNANLVTLSIRETIALSPFFVITNEAHHMTRAAQEVLEQVLSRLN